MRGCALLLGVGRKAGEVHAWCTSFSPTFLEVANALWNQRSVGPEFLVVYLGVKKVTDNFPWEPGREKKKKEERMS